MANEKHLTPLGALVRNLTDSLKDSTIDSDKIILDHVAHLVEYLCQHEKQMVKKAFTDGWNAANGIKDVDTDVYFNDNYTQTDVS